MSHRDITRSCRMDALRMDIRKLVKERDAALERERVYRKALEIAINTVECASLDKDGNKLPWYIGARNALSQTSEVKNG